MTKILAIDDQKVNLTDLKYKIKLINPDINFISITDAKEGIELAIKENPDIIILDIMMPQIDGYEVCRQLKDDKRTKTIPVIFLTVLDNDRQNRIKAVEVGGDAFLTRPVDEIELKVQINAMLKIRNSNIKILEEKCRLEKLVEKRTRELQLELEKRKKTEIELRENEERYRELVESSPDIIYIFSSKKGVTFGTKKANKVLEIPQEKFTKDPFLWIKLVHPEGQHLVKRVIDKNFEESNFEIEYKIKDGNGNWRWVSDRSIKRYIKDDEVIIKGIVTDITKRKLAEENLRKNEKERRRITDNIPGAVYQLIKHTNGKMNFTFLGSKSVDGIHLTEEQLVRNPELFYQSLHPDDLKKLISTRENSLNNHQPFQTDVRFIKPDNSITWLRINAIPETLEDGTAIVTGIALNISENKLAEEKIRESEEKYRLLVTQMDQGLAVHEGIFNENGKMTDYRFIDFNKSFEKQTGLKKSETIGKTLLEVLPNSESYWIEKYENVLKTGKALHFDNFAREMGKHFEVIAYKIRQNQFATVIADITEKKRDFKELSLHNQRQEALLKIFRSNSKSTGKLLDYVLQEAIHLSESKNGVLFLFNKENQITIGSCSERFNKNTGGKRSVFKLDEIGVWGEAAKQHKPIIINNFQNSKNAFQCISSRDQHQLPKNILSIPVLIKNEIKAIIGISDKDEDYTHKDIKQISLLIEAAWTVIERRKHVEELKAAKEKAEESDKLKSAFLANMSHEIRTPMNGIMGFAELLKDPHLTKDEQTNYLAIIEKSGERMLNTINDLIDISRIESNLVEVNLSEFNINDQMNYLYHFFKLEAKNKGLQLKYKNILHDERALIISDKDKVNAILMNLIKNSIKYTNKGEIEFGYSVNSESLQFFVKDTGVGIKKDRQKAVFERFVQADISISRPYEGVGLGLSIAKAYVEMLGGKIGVESEEGKGSHFFFKIPVQTNAPKIFQDEKSINGNGSPENILKELTILVAEDDETGKMYLEHLLEGKCKKVIFAKNGYEAVEYYKKNTDINLVLMDMRMPEMDGYSATRKIKEINHEAVVIGQSAFALPGDKEKSLNAGCIDYLTKPLEKEKLIKTIYKIFKN